MIKSFHCNEKKLSPDDKSMKKDNALINNKESTPFFNHVFE
jgi:hypothetical protein